MRIDCDMTSAVNVALTAALVIAGLAYTFVGSAGMQVYPRMPESVRWWFFVFFPLFWYIAYEESKPKVPDKSLEWLGRVGKKVWDHLWETDPIIDLRRKP